jgi:hypothetical protein
MALNVAMSRVYPPPVWKGGAEKCELRQGRPDHLAPPLITNAVQALMCVVAGGRSVLGGGVSATLLTVLWSPGVPGFCRPR